MSKKAQAFHDVSEAITLDSNGFHEIAFQKYLESLHSLSELLVNQFCYDGHRELPESKKKEARQLLSVVSDCVERACVILNGNNDISGVSSANEHCESSNDSSGNCGLNDGLSSTSNYVSSSSQQSRNHIARFPVFDKVEKENSLLYSRFQIRIENAKDKYSRSNLQLELQRRLAENLEIARTKSAQLMKQQQEERKKIFEIAMKNMSKMEPCLNENDQDRRDLYLHILQYEANHTNYLSINTSESPSEIVEKIFHQIFGFDCHPLTQWFLMKQLKIRGKLNVLINSYSCYKESLPENSPHLFGGVRSVTCEIPAPLPSYKKTSMTIQESIDLIAQDIQESIETILQVFCHVYKNELPPDSDTFAYKLIELSLLRPLWALFILACRFANINAERRIAFTMHYCEDSNPEEFGIPSNLIPKESVLFQDTVIHLRKIPFFSCIMAKLKVLVDVSKNLGEIEITSNESNKIGANEFVPILSYILVHTSMPQLLSECRALELLLDPKYMLGEEGYALTSFQAALSYLELKKSNEENAYQRRNETGEESA